VVSEEKIFQTLANQKQELPLAAIFVGGTEKTVIISEIGQEKNDQHSMI
jgi:hypothetical protein